jgi:cytochrome c-type biogenesis protein
MNVQFAWAFAAGMLAAVNPCGFAMLPAYLSYFLGIERTTERTGEAGVLRAIVVTLAVAAGFFAVFAPLGIAVNAGVQWIRDVVPWLTVVIGVALIALGIAMLFGYRLPFTTPKLDKGGKDRTLLSMFVFGVSYAVASISCTLPVFIPVMSSGFAEEGMLAGVLTFLTYAAGMAGVLAVLTIALALAKQGMVRRLRSAMAFVDRASSVLLLIAGAYLVYYGIWEITTDSGLSSDSGGGVVDWAQRTIVTPFSGWVQGQGGGRLALGVGLIVSAAVLASYALRALREGEPKPPLDHHVEPHRP